MEGEPPSSVGLVGSLRGLADGLLGSVHDRLELATIELQEEKYRLIQILVWTSSLVVLAVLAIIFLSFALIVVLWDTARVAVVCSLAGVYLLGLVAAVLAFRHYLKNQPRPFAGTVAELRQDRECIQADN